jgi:hypothetical protein
MKDGHKSFYNLLLFIYLCLKYGLSLDLTLPEVLEPPGGYL